MSVGGSGYMEGAHTPYTPVLEDLEYQAVPGWTLRSGGFLAGSVFWIVGCEQLGSRLI